MTAIFCVPLLFEQILIDIALPLSSVFNGSFFPLPFLTTDVNSELCTGTRFKKIQLSSPVDSGLSYNLMGLSASGLGLTTLRRYSHYYGILWS